MNFSLYTRQDWLLIRSAIIWLGSAMLFAGVLLLGTQIYLYFSEQEQKALHVQLQQAIGFYPLLYIGFPAKLLPLFFAQIAD